MAANLLLGANQGLAWSMTVVMKIDLVGPVRRGLALGLNESAGYLGVAAAAFVTGALAASFAPRTLVWVGAAAIAALGTAISIFFVRDTGAHVAREQLAHGRAESRETLRAAFARATVREPMLRACSQAGLVNNLNDALAWGLAPLYLAAHGASATEIGIVAGVYPAVWGAGQLLTGWLSDHTGRKPLIDGRNARAGGSARAPGRGRRRLRVGARRRGPPRCRDGARLPNLDRGRLRRRAAGRARTGRGRLPLLARLRLRGRGAPRRARRRRRRSGYRDRDRRGPDGGKRALGRG